MCAASCRCRHAHGQTALLERAAGARMTDRRRSYAGTPARGRRKRGPRAPPDAETSPTTGEGRMHMAVAFMVGPLAYPLRLPRTMLADTVHPSQSAPATSAAPDCITLGTGATPDEPRCSR